MAGPSHPIYWGWQTRNYTFMVILMVKVLILTG